VLPPSPNEQNVRNTKGEKKTKKGGKTRINKIMGEK